MTRDRFRSTAKLMAPLVVTCLLGAPALAQSEDTNRDDASEIFSDDADEDITAIKPSQSDQGWSVDLALTGLYTTNADQTLHDQVSTGYVTPALTLRYDKQPLPQWSLSFDVTAEADAFREMGSELNESRITSTARANYDFGTGVMVLGVRTRTAFDGVWKQYAYTRAGPFLSLRPRGTGNVRLRIDADYRFSDEPGQRRFLVVGRAEFPLVNRPEIGRLKLIQEARLSYFRSGRNTGRRDIRLGTAISYYPPISIANNVVLKIDAVFFNNFSNFNSREFTDFEIGPTLTLAF